MTTLDVMLTVSIHVKSHLQMFAASFSISDPGLVLLLTDRFSVTVGNCAWGRGERFLCIWRFAAAFRRLCSLTISSVCFLWYFLCLLPLVFNFFMLPSDCSLQLRVWELRSAALMKRIKQFLKELSSFLWLVKS